MIVIYNPTYKSFSIYRYGIEKKVYSWSDDSQFSYEGACQYDFHHVKRGMWVTYNGFAEKENNVIKDILSFFTDDYTKCPLASNFHKKEYIIYDGDLNVCFTSDGNMVLYKNDLNYTPERIITSFKRLTKNSKKLANKWGVPDDSLHTFSTYYKKDKDCYELNIWNFKSNSDFVVIPRILHDIYCFAPEIFNYKKEKEYLDRYKTSVSESCNFLYNLEPFNTSRSYDVSPEDRKKINDEIEAKRIAEENRIKRLEKLKHTDGYCSICGAPHASYVVNPYYYEMYGDEHKEWLCDKCYDDACGDI